MTFDKTASIPPDAGPPRFLSGPVGLALALVAALGLKALLLAWGSLPFNADEAVVGLMARHILEGERPIFFYGQAYLGSLDAWLVAAGFVIAGVHVWVIRAVQVVLYLATIILTHRLARQTTGSEKAAWAAAMLMAVPVVGVTLYTTVSIGGYGEALVIGDLLLLTALAIKESPGRGRLWFAWGLLSGLGLWVFGLTLVYSLASLVLVLPAYFQAQNRVRRWRQLWVAALGAGLGAAPWLGWAAANGPGALIGELGGSAIAGASPGGFLASVGSHLVNLLLFGPTVMMGIRPPWSVATLAWPLVPLALVFWLGVLAWAGLRRFRLGASRGGGPLMASLAAVLLAGFVLTPFGADPSGRYFLPMAVVMAVFGGAWVAHLYRTAGGTWAAAALAAVLLFNLVSTVQVAKTNPPGLTTAFDPVAQIDESYLPDLASFLQAQGETRGFTNYWVAYPLAFVSDERLVFIPTLPYHQDFRYTPRDDRYVPYDELVLNSDRLAYITTNHPALEEAIAAQLRLRGVTFKQARIGPYHVVYDLSQPVRLTAEDLAPTEAAP